MLTSLRFVVTHGRLPIRDRYWRRPCGRLRLRYAVMGYATTTASLSFLALSLFPVIAVPIGKASDTLMAQLTAPPASVQVTLIPARSEPILTAAIKAIATPGDIDQAIATLPEPALIIPQIKPATPPSAPTVEVAMRSSEMLDAHRDTTGQIRRDNDARITNAVVQAEEHRAISPRAHQLTIAAGDTLSTLLVRAGLSADDSERAIKAMREHVQPSDLRPGQTLQLELAPPEAPYQFNRLSLAVDPVRTVEVKRGWGGFMTAAVVEKPLKNDVTAQVAVIKASLYGAAAAAGIPTGITAEAIKAFAHNIDFQRDIHPGDRLEIMYDRMVTDDGYVAKPGNLLFARLYADGRELSIYRYESKDGRVDYYDGKGNSIRKALLRTPMDGGRITSGFGMRRHPLLGYSKMHKGIDFGATTGTPVFASGDAVVEKASRFGAYGNYIRLQHNSRLETAYAHLSRYGDGIRPGVRVHQGQIIGYVGTTGRSTGPHLHYEILINGEQVNPQSIKMPTITALEGQDLKGFKAMVDRLGRQFREKTNGIHYASVGANEAVVQR